MIQDDKGKLIIFEGADDVGKTTLSQAFARLLTSRGVDTKWLSFPGRDPDSVGNLVYELHHNSAAFGIPTLTPSCIQALHIAAHLDAIERVIHPLLKAGQSIVLDRFWWSTWAYGKCTGVNLSILEHLIRAEMEAWENIRPSMAFLISRTTNLELSEKQSMRNNLNSAYREIAHRQQSEHPVVEIRNDGTIENTLNNLVEAFFQ